MNSTSNERGLACSVPDAQTESRTRPARHRAFEAGCKGEICCNFMPNELITTCAHRGPNMAEKDPH